MLAGVDIALVRISCSILQYFAALERFLELETRENRQEHYEVCYQSMMGPTTTSIGIALLESDQRIFRVPYSRRCSHRQPCTEWENEADLSASFVEGGACVEWSIK